MTIDTSGDATGQRQMDQPEIDQPEIRQPAPGQPRSATRVAARVVDVVVLAPAPRPSAGPDEAAQSSNHRWRVLALRRAAGVRCTGAWETVHGTIEAGELPAAAARREVFEETGLTVERLYSITVNPFYLHQLDTVQLAIVFAAVVSADAPVQLGIEHDAYRWLTPAESEMLLQWPREHEAVRHATWLLRTGDAGPAEDVLLVR